MADDRFQLSARSRLVVTTIIFLSFIFAHPVMAIHQIALPTFGVVLFLGWLSIPFILLCLVALSNAVNMADGRNGLVIGMCLIWVLALIYGAANPWPIGLMMLLVSLCLAFVCNLQGRFFLGDGGTYGLAAYLGLSVIAAHNHAPQSISVMQILCLFLVPGLDLLRVMVARLRRGVSPLAADHGHFHHALDDWIGWKAGLPLYLALVASPTFAAFAVQVWAGGAFVLGIIAYFLVFVAARYHWRLDRTWFSEQSRPMALAALLDHREPENTGAELEA